MKQDGKLDGQKAMHDLSCWEQIHASAFLEQNQCNIMQQSQSSALMQIQFRCVIIQMKFKAIWLIAAIILALTQSVRSAHCPDCFITQVCGPYHWTKWINRDRPSGTGDWETVADSLPLGGCKLPIYLECQTTTGVPHYKTGEIIQFSTTIGCICVNSIQPDKKCDFDYQVRQLCPN